ncbi:hypothetical protein CWI36_0014p0030 [Hamiltosporidium magnivora]|uniref:Uncharacterized protein n=1 Tax=Hamiltosporidium magnivora TaxID=148818 RepID=A0A4Q9LMM5_9MICR|nr:hypothetical protein CWI36_0014p0030 [Hamiltosporidium magnivora]
MGYVIHNIPQFDGFCNFFKPFFNKSNDKIIERGFINVKDKILKNCKKNKYDEYILCNMLYTECIALFTDEMYDVCLYLDIFNEKTLLRIKDMLLQIQSGLEDLYFINQLKNLKKWDSKKLSVEENQPEIFKVFDEFLSNEIILQYFFSQFCLFWDCFFVPKEKFSDIMNDSYIFKSKRVQNYYEQGISYDDYFENIKKIYKSMNWSQIIDLFLMIYFIFPFDYERTSFQICLLEQTNILEFNHEFNNFIFPNSNIFGKNPDSNIIGRLNNCKSINFSIMIESEYLIAVFIKDFIKKIGEKKFLQMLCMVNFENKKTNFYQNLEYLNMLEPFKTEFIVNLSCSLEFLKKDVHIVFAFRKLDVKLFKFMKNQILEIITSKNSRLIIENEIFANSEIFEFFLICTSNTCKRQQWV